MTGMFQNCHSITSLNLTGFNSINVKNIDYMFSECYNLEHLNLQNFNTLKCNSFNDTFYNCKKLEVILNPNYCENIYFYIPDYVQVKNITNTNPF